MGTATSIKLDDRLKDRVQRLAEARHRSPHWIMHEAITEYIDREEKRQAFYQDALRAWKEYRETGLHATGEDVDRWLASWGTDHELPAPKCHT